MACVQNPVQGDSEREEGEIVDDLDELSDISSEEEYLLRQRLHMLEKYNNVLERKNAKRTISDTGKNEKNNDAFLCDLSEISATELEEPYVVSKNIKEQKHLKSYHKPKRRKDPLTVNNLAKRIHRKKSNKGKKKTAIPESSDESDDEYRNKRRKLANAVSVNKPNVDKTSLKARLEKMLCGSHQDLEKNFPNTLIETPLALVIEEASLEKIQSPESSFEVEKDENKDNLHNATINVYESIDLCSMSDIVSLCDTKSEYNGSNISAPSGGHDTVDSAQEPIVSAENVIIDETQKNRDSDEDLELLREHALKTKTVKTNSKNKELEKQNTDQIAEAKEALLLSGEEDSDTAELRLICLKSALLKKAFERKQKLKQRRKRMSQSCNLNDELMREQIEYMNLLSDNNTDIESVDMDIGSDGDEKSKDFPIESSNLTNTDFEKFEKLHPTETDEKNIKKLINPKEDEFEEDEDLLRAKLLTSLSKNLPNLIHPNVINNATGSDSLKKDNETEKQANNVTEEKRFIISIGNSDSEGEHEATKNLTKMHLKLSEQAEFQQKLDLFLKSTRMEVEKSVLPDVVQQPLVPPLPKTKEKFVPKTVKHLPKSEQIEYKSLVKRMAELEKIKNARQSSINLVNKGTQQKETLKPHNFGTRQPLNNDLDEQIALSRKTIAEESAKVLKLKEDATKLSHKYKIVSTELRNIATAITFNKKQQKVSQIKLSKIRTQHQMLINSSSTSKHSISNGNLAARGLQKLTSAPSKRPQKENAPLKEEVKTVQLYSPALSELQSVKVSVVNDRMEETNPRLSVQIDVTSNKKTVKIPKNSVNNSFELENNVESRTDRRTIDANEELVDRGGKKDKERTISNWGSTHKLEGDDYKSPLQALGSANWEEDPNAVICRFEIGGHCKDADCKYLHPRQ